MKLPTLYNTLSRRPQPFVPKDPQRVGVYCCGPTVYDLPHAGHARAALTPDVLVRFLRARGQPVTYVRNITDVDDKILARSQQTGQPPLSLSAKMAEIYRDQMHAFGCLDPDHEPKVSEHLDQIVELTAELERQGAAYVVERPEGTRDVYFSVRSFPGYGMLSRRRLDELRVGARVEKDTLKRDPLDFALWKGALEEQWGWPSPWGRGRPGWHIECSAMSRCYLGHGFDIHAGGMDLIFPHHENEIAQSEAARPEAGPFARFWIHNGFVNVDREKMSKSLGNFVTISDIFERNDPEALRWFLLSVHYRGPVQFDTETLSDGRVIFPGVDEAERRVDYLHASLRRLEELLVGEVRPSKRDLGADLGDIADAARQALAAAEQGMLDDLNTSVAVASLGELARAANELCDRVMQRRKDVDLRARASVLAAEIRDNIDTISDWLGLLQTSGEVYRTRTRERRARVRGLSSELVQDKITARQQARQTRDFARADQLRAELTALGVSLRDTPEGTVWSIEV